MVTGLLVIGGGISSCSDSYDLDEKKPSWLNVSIYKTLENSGDHTYYLRLIADPDVNTTSESGEGTESLKDILSRTGSKTVFAADDDAWEAFFESNAELSANNPWHNATCYENLSKNQKKLLLHTSMLNNAIVMENLASSSGSSPVRGQYMRMETDIESTDTVTRIACADLPKTNWSKDKQKHTDENVEVDQWGRIRNGGLLHYDSIYMVQDSSTSMMVTFTREFMANNSITDNDFRILMNGRTRKTSDVHIYSAHLDSADIVCENGYLNYCEQPLVPLANMAEVIRTNGNTNIFSHILERFSVPYTCNTVGRVFGNLYPEKFDKDRDTLYMKEYYSERSWGSTKSYDFALKYSEEGDLFAGNGLAILKYDPGWNQYHPNGSEVNEDFGAMFVPADEEMLDYFRNGGGKTLIDEYTLDPYDKDEYAISGDGLRKLMIDMDQIPLEKIAKIVNQVMIRSFVSYGVPSKMLKYRDTDTQEQIFEESDTKMASEGGNIKKVLLSCNGPVYIMNNVFTPSDFDCVATPAFIRSTNKIMYWAIYSDKDLGTGALMGINYYAYLKAMQSRFSFFLPTDDAMNYYYDAMSFNSNKPRVMRFLYNNTGTFPFAVKTMKADGETKYALADYDQGTGEIGKNQTNQSTSQAEILNRFRRMLEENTIVHESGENTIQTDEDEYYLSKNGMGIKVTRGATGDNKILYAQGGFQLENDREITDPSVRANCSTGVLRCNVNVANDYKNGWTFTVDAPLIPAARSVYSVMGNLDRTQAKATDRMTTHEENNPYWKFFTYCNPQVDITDIICKCGLVDETQYNRNTTSGKKALDNAINKYLTFVNNNSVDYGVQFWQNYNYTVFAPSNEAIDAAQKKGLPTWESISEDFDGCKKDGDGNLTTTEDSLRIAAKITYLTNFIRTHFVDNSIFADKSDMAEKEMVSSSFNNTSGTFVRVNVKRNNQTLYVKDAVGGDWEEAYKEDPQFGKDVRNVMTCDRECSNKVQAVNTLNGITVESSNYAVVHLINGVLNHTALDENGNYVINWKSPAAARAYINKFKIR